MNRNVPSRLPPLRLSYATGVPLPSEPPVPRRPQPTSTGFRAETELAPLVDRWLRDHGASCVGHEVAAGVGVPDLMGGVGSAVALDARRRMAPPIPDSLQLRLMQFCRRPRTLSELRHWAPNGFSALKRRALEPLIEALLLHMEDAAVSAAVELDMPFHRTIAVELKLRPSTRALRQAQGYRVVAEQVYLAFPAHTITPVLRDQVHAYGIGLLSITAEDVALVEAPGPSLGVAQRQRRLVGERILAAAVDGERVGGAARR